MLVFWLFTKCCLPWLLNQNCLSSGSVTCWWLLRTQAPRLPRGAQQGCGPWPDLPVEDPCEQLSFYKVWYSFRALILQQGDCSCTPFMLRILRCYAHLKDSIFQVIFLFSCPVGMQSLTVCRLLLLRSGARASQSFVLSSETYLEVHYWIFDVFKLSEKVCVSLSYPCLWYVKVAELMSWFSPLPQLKEICKSNRKVAKYIK